MSAPPKIFITGVTGYVGGDTIVALLEKYPAWESSISVLVRDAERGALITAVFHKIRLVYGGLDDAAVLEEEAAKADIILNFADSDHLPSANALVRGTKRHTGGKPVFLIHTSGTGILFWKTIDTGIYGDLEPKVYDDWDGIDELTSLPDFAPHRNVEKVILEAGNDDNGPVKTTIVCPPIIYGLGRGPGNKRGKLLYDLARITLTSGEGMRVGKGENRQTHIHVYDLSDLYILLVEQAAKGGGNATWGKKGYYFASNGDHAWGEVGKMIANVAYKQGFLASDKVSEFSPEQLAKFLGHRQGTLFFGGNGRENAIRGRKLLGFNPSRPSIFDEVPEAVASEAAKLGLTQRK